MSFAQDLRAVAWKEARELTRQRSTLVSAGFMLAVFGVLLPVQAGVASLRSLEGLPSFLIIPFATIVAFIADAFAGERERHTLESLLATRLSDRAILAGKILVAVGYGWGLVLVRAVVAVVAVNLSAPHGGGFVGYAPTVLFGGLGLGLLVALFMSSLGVLVSLRAATVKQAQQVLAIAVAFVAVLALAGGALLPDAWRAPLLRFFVTAGEARVLLVVASILAAVDVALLAACDLRFRRARLILD